MKNICIDSILVFFAMQFESKQNVAQFRISIQLISYFTSIRIGNKTSKFGVGR
jgi:uncharacterized membrane protein